MGFLDFLGAALQTGVKTYNTLDNEEYERDQREKERQDALARHAEQLALQQAAARRAQEGQDFQRAAAQRESIEGGQNVDPDVFEFIKKQGLGSGFSDTSTFALPQSSPEGGMIAPPIEKLRTRQEQMQETQLSAAQDERQREQSFLEWMGANPQAKHDDVRAKALASGLKVPEPSMADQRELVDYQHKNRLQEIAAQNAGDLAERRASRAEQLDPRSRMWLDAAQNEVMRLGQLYAPQLKMVAESGKEGEYDALVMELQNRAKTATERQYGPFPGLRLAGEPAAGAAPAPAAGAQGSPTMELISSIDGDAQAVGGYDKLLTMAKSKPRVQRMQADGVDVNAYLQAIKVKSQRIGPAR
jgi:hypothetical protein